MVQPTPDNGPACLPGALTLLEAVATHADGVGVREAARQTGIDRSAVSRILAQFEDLCYVEQNGARGVYTAGPGLFALVAALSERDSPGRRPNRFSRIWSLASTKPVTSPPESVTAWCSAARSTASTGSAT
jgi:IclR helix-turn-helix domain